MICAYGHLGEPYTTKSTGQEQCRVCKKEYMRNKGPVYRAWKNMKHRCNSPSFKQYADYGGRGIGYCKEWEDFTAFKDDMQATYRAGLTLDRVDNDGNYGPENCKWSTWREQGSNKRNNVWLEIDGISKTMSQWAQDSGLQVSTIWRRINRYGWDTNRALSIKEASDAKTK